MTTVQGFLLQVLHHNTACSHVPHLLGKVGFVGSLWPGASSTAAGTVSAIAGEVCRRARSCLDESATLAWASRVAGGWIELLDARHARTATSLRPAGAASSRLRLSGSPFADAVSRRHGLLLRTIAAPLRTHDLAQASQLHAELAAGDVLIADRGFCSYAHVALLIQAGLHAVFRLHQKQLVELSHRPDAQPARSDRTKTSKACRKRAGSNGWAPAINRSNTSSRRSCPIGSMPRRMPRCRASLVLRELRYRIEQPGCRTREVILITTLVDAELYPAAELAGSLRPALAGRNRSAPPETDAPHGRAAYQDRSPAFTKSWPCSRWCIIWFGW